MTWQQFLDQGNALFHQQEYSQSENYYQRAQSLTELMLEHNNYSEEAIYGWVCCCHNLADLYQRQGQLSLALHSLLETHERITNLVQDDLDGLNTTALNATRITFRALVEFQQSFPETNSCMCQQPRSNALKH